MRIVRFLVAVGGTLSVIAAGLGLWLHHSLWGTRSAAPVSLEIAEGAPARLIIDQLHDQGLVPSRWAGRLYVRMWADGRSMHYGRYRFEEGSRPVDILEMVLEGNLEMFEVTVVEGASAKEIGALFSSIGVGSEAAWTFGVPWCGE